MERAIRQRDPHRVHLGGGASCAVRARVGGGSAFDFAPLASTFRTAGFGVVAFDHQVHGRSSGSRATLPQMAAATLDVARAVGPIVAVVGHSLGATAALFALGGGLTAKCAVLIAPPYVRCATSFGSDRPKDGIAGTRASRVRLRCSNALRHGRREATNRIGVRDCGCRVWRLHDVEDRQVPFAHGAAVAPALARRAALRLSGIGHRKALLNPAVHRDIVGFVQENVK